MSATLRTYDEGERPPESPGTGIGSCPDDADGSFYCTRGAGHDGLHEAGDMNHRVVATWGDEDR